MQFRISVRDRVLNQRLRAFSGNFIGEVDQALLTQYRTWCRERIGANGWAYYGQYRKIPFEFRFRREEDLLAFRLAHGV